MLCKSFLGKIPVQFPVVDEGLQCNYVISILEAVLYTITNITAILGAGQAGLRSLIILHQLHRLFGTE
jgi:hypothetical protein